MSRRRALSLVFAALAVGAALAHAAWVFLGLSGSTADAQAWFMSLLGVAGVPLSMTASGAALLPPELRWLHWPMLGGVGLASVAVASGIAAGFFADDLPMNPGPADVATDIALVALALLVVLFSTVVFRLWVQVSAIPRAALAVATGVVGSAILTGLIAAVMPVWVAAVAMLVTLLVLRRVEFRERSFSPSVDR